MCVCFGPHLPATKSLVSCYAKEMIGNGMHQADVGVALGLAFLYKAGLLPLSDVGH